MSPDPIFPGKINAFSKHGPEPMRVRIPAATLPYTRRKLYRKQCRIPLFNRSVCEPLSDNDGTPVLCRR
jgi:hypothetical protein